MGKKPGIILFQECTDSAQCIQHGLVFHRRQMVANLLPCYAAANLFASNPPDSFCQRLHAILMQQDMQTSFMLL